MIQTVWHSGTCNTHSRVFAISILRFCVCVCVGACMVGGGGEGCTGGGGGGGAAGGESVCVCTGSLPSSLLMSYTFVNITRTGCSVRNLSR